MLFEPKIRICANSPCSECMSPSDEHTNCFTTRLCARANKVIASLISSFKDFAVIISHQLGFDGFHP